LPGPVPILSLLEIMGKSFFYIRFAIGNLYLGGRGLGGRPS
jgi:hypothetical protein